MNDPHAIDRASPLPLYAQVKRRLQSRILTWPADNDRFHTDEELCELFQVSRATVRKALAELEHEGLLSRRQGYGTLVNRHKIEETFSAQADFSDQWAEAGRSLAVELLRCENVPCPAAFAAALGLDPGEPVLHIERLRLAGAMRIAWDRRYIPVAVARGVARKEWSKVSLLAVLARVITFDRGETRIESALAGEEYAERLHLLPNDPVLIRHMTYFDVDGRAVMAGVSVYRADQVRYKFSIPMRAQAGNADAEVRLGAATVGKGAARKAK